MYQVTKDLLRPYVRIKSGTQSIHQFMATLLDNLDPEIDPDVPSPTRIEQRLLNVRPLKADAIFEYLERALTEEEYLPDSEEYREVIRAFVLKWAQKTETIRRVRYLEGVPSVVRYVKLCPGYASRAEATPIDSYPNTELGIDSYQELVAHIRADLFQLVPRFSPNHSLEKDARASRPSS